MKRVVAVIFSFAIGASAFGQSYNLPNFSNYSKAFVDFADGISSALPLYSSIGNNWSSGYGGQFPHLGFGLTIGATTIPGDVVNNLTNQLNLGSVSTLFPAQAGDVIAKYGVPLPGYVAEVRIGGFVIPFDIGLKIGYIGDKMEGLQNVLPAKMKLDYLLTGFDVKFPIVKEGFLMPQIAVGGGFNFVRGYVSFPTSSTDMTFPNTPTLPNGHYYGVQLTAPNMEFQWNSKVFDAKVQVSKHLLIFTPYLGFGMSYGISSAGGGLSSQLRVSEDGGAYASPTQDQLNAINQYLAYNGSGGSFSVDGTSILVSAGANGLGFRAFGGVSIDLLIVHLDANLMYDIIGKGYGATVGLRIQW